MPTNPNAGAYPSAVPPSKDHQGRQLRDGFHELGLTKREHFAGCALIGLLNGVQGLTTQEMYDAVNMSVQAADALIAVLK